MARFLSFCSVNVKVAGVYIEYTNADMGLLFLRDLYALHVQLFYRLLCVHLISKQPDLILKFMDSVE